MRHLTRLLALLLVAGLLAAAPVAASSSGAAAQATSAPTSTSDGTPLSTAKVVIIVGATGSATSNYRDIGDSAYATAIQYSSNVVKVYSPNATWSAAKAAMTGASVVVYLGHGNGWPSPYTYDANYTTKDGLGLNSTANNGDSNTKYYGEPSLDTVSLAPNAVVLLNHLCYASGNSEPQNPAPTQSVAKQRADNYGQGFIKAGARAVIAEGHGSINGMIRDLFTTHQSVVDLWRNQYDYHHNEFSFESMRNAAYDVFMDPDTASGGYYRSLVGNPDIRTEDVTGVPFLPTDTTPDSLQSPGAATVAGDPKLYNDPSLTDDHGSLADGTALRVEDLSTSSNFGGGADAPAALVATLDGTESGWMATTALAPQDSMGPQLWSLDGSKTITPNGDGVTDAMNLALRFSEAVTWSATVRDGGGHEVWTASGSGATAALKWDAKVGGVLVANGAYSLRIQAQDEWGNDPLSDGASLTIDKSVLPTRLAGADRYATAVAISKATYAPGVPVVYIATGANFPDALAGAAAAGTAGGPLLTVPGTTIPAATAAELTRLKPAKIIVLGSSAAVSDGVKTQLGTYTAGTVTRLAGADRYATAVAISKATYAPGVPVVYIATGANFPDALAGAAAAGTAGGPLLTVPGTTIPAATAAELTRLKPAKIIVLGSSAAVSDGVKTQLGTYTAGTVTRLAGADRYATAVAISKATYAPGVPVVYIATGANFPDALAGAAAAGTAGGPLLTVPGTTIPAATAAELTRLKPAKIIVLGSSAAVSQTVLTAMKVYIAL